MCPRSKRKTTELPTQNLVHIQSMAPHRHALTLRTKRQRSRSHSYEVLITVHLVSQRNAGLMCVQSLVLIAQVVFLLDSGHTHRNTKSLVPLITLPTHWLPPPTSVTKKPAFASIYSVLLTTQCHAEKCYCYIRHSQGTACQCQAACAAGGGHSSLSNGLTCRLRRWLGVARNADVCQLQLAVRATGYWLVAQYKKTGSA